MNPLYDLLRADGSIVMNKSLIFSIGHHESIIYAELVSRFNYFSDKNRLTEDGYFFNTINDLHAGTGLSEKPQRTAIKNLKKLGLIDVSLRGIPPRRYFTIVDNFDLIRDLLELGKINQAAILVPSQLRLLGGNKDSRIAESNTPYGRTNNTNPNNTKEIIQKVYINLPIDGHIFFNIYGRHFYNKFGKEHMKLTTEQLDEVESKIGALISYDVNATQFEEEVINHFDDLPKSNNGNIIAFLKATSRYFSVDTTEY